VNTAAPGDQKKTEQGIAAAQSAEPLAADAAMNTAAPGGQVTHMHQGSAQAAAATDAALAESMSHSSHYQPSRHDREERYAYEAEQGEHHYSHSPEHEHEREAPSHGQHDGEQNEEDSSSHKHSAEETRDSEPHSGYPKQRDSHHQAPYEDYAPAAPTVPLYSSIEGFASTFVLPAEGKETSTGEVTATEANFRFWCKYRIRSCMSSAPEGLLRMHLG
jgi:hypothetical protein